MSEVAGGEGGMEMQDPSALFGSLFGGERFKDLIGEISLVKGELELVVFADQGAEVANG